MRTTHPTQRRHKLVTRQQGFTLIEVMVTSTILLICILGTMRQQAYSMDTIREGFYMSKASQLVNQMAERMRNNPEGVIADNYIFPSNEPVLPLAVGEAVPEHCPCTSYALQAQQDVAHWQAGLRELPEYDSGSQVLKPNGFIELVSNTPAYNTYRVTVSWPSPDRIRDKGALPQMKSFDVLVGFDVN